MFPPFKLSGGRVLGHWEESGKETREGRLSHGIQPFFRARKGPKNAGGAAEETFAVFSPSEVSRSEFS